MPFRAGFQADEPHEDVVRRLIITAYGGTGNEVASNYENLRRGLLAIGLMVIGCDAEAVPVAPAQTPRGELEVIDEIVEPPPQDDSPPDPCPHVQNGVTIEPDRLIVEGDIGFDLYAPAVAEDAWPTIDAVAARVVHCDDVRVEVQVHTSAFGMSSFNARSSTAIAEAIRARMIAQGVPEDRVAACGYGETRPIADNIGRDGRSQNERVEWARISGSADAHTCPSL